MLHERERGDESQQHLDENFDKFKGDMKIVMQLLYSGKRLTAQSLVKDYGIHDRRLRDAIAARPDVIKKVWVKDKNDKRLYVEYFADLPPSPTKRAAIEMGERILKQMKDNELNQGELF
jgi:hypothetical protein